MLVLGYVEHTTCFVTDGSIQFLSAQSPWKQPSGQRGQCWDRWQTCRYPRAPPAPRLWLCPLDAASRTRKGEKQWGGYLILPGSLRRVFEMELLVERELLSCLDPGLFLSHPDNFPHLCSWKWSTSERLALPLSGLPPCKLLWCKSACISEQNRCW